MGFCKTTPGIVSRQGFLAGFKYVKQGKRRNTLLTSMSLNCQNMPPLCLCFFPFLFPSSVLFFPHFFLFPSFFPFLFLLFFLLPSLLSLPLKNFPQNFSWVAHPPVATLLLTTGAMNAPLLAEVRNLSELTSRLISKLNRVGPIQSFTQVPSCDPRASCTEIQLSTYALFYEEWRVALNSNST